MNPNATPIPCAAPDTGWHPRHLAVFDSGRLVAAVPLCSGRLPGALVPMGDGRIGLTGTLVSPALERDAAARVLGDLLRPPPGRHVDLEPLEAPEAELVAEATVGPEGGSLGDDDVTVTAAPGALPAAAVLALGAAGFLYGVFHAAGPGHGKVVITTYLATQRETLWRGIALAVASSLVQGLVAIVDREQSAHFQALVDAAPKLIALLPWEPAFVFVRGRGRASRRRSRPPGAATARCAAGRDPRP